MNTNDTITFERSLTIGQSVRILWTCGSFGHFEGTGTVKKINRASVRVSLSQPVNYGDHVGWEAGKEIVVPLLIGSWSNSKWASFNRVAPL